MPLSFAIDLSDVDAMVAREATLFDVELSAALAPEQRVGRPENLADERLEEGYDSDDED